MKMRELEARTGVNRETIRVFLRHGLIPEPSRPKPNVADYDESHVRAIQAVRDLQRNSAMTLKQIQDTLGGENPEQRIEASAFHNLEALVATRVGIDVQPVLLEAMCKAFPNAAADAQRLQSIGVVEVLDSPGGPALSITDARLVTIWSEMQQAGFNEANGFPPEIVNFYIDPAERVAEREATLVLERTEGRISEDEAARMLQIALRLMLDFFGLIRMKRFMAHIHREQPASSGGKRRRQPSSRSRSRPSKGASSPAAAR